MTILSRAWAATAEGVRELPRWLVYTLAGGAFLLFWGLPTLIVPLATDQVLFSLGARTILDGGQLYRDYWEIKGPLIFLIYAVPAALVGDHMEAVRVLDLLNTGVAMAAVFLLSRRLFNERVGLIAAALYGFTYLTWARLDGLAETESFMAAPLALAFYFYPARAGGRTVVGGAFAAGLLLGIAFGLKTTAILFVLGLPAMELLWRGESAWSLSGASRRLAIAAAGFVLVQAAWVAYLAVGGVLDDFIDIQRHYTAPYNNYRWGGAEGSHARFVLQGTSDWVKDSTFIIVPAATALFFAFFQPQRSKGVLLLSFLVALGVLGVWWQGKMFRYHWLVMIPLLSPLAGYALDRALDLFSTLGARRAWVAGALLAGGLIVLAADRLQDTYDNYRTLVSYADGSLSRREVEVRYNPLLLRNHAIVDYMRANGDQDDTLFIWGLWPVAYYWAEQQPLDRFIANHGLRSTWSPASWRGELMGDLRAAPPRFIAVARGDNQPWLTGTTQTSDEYLRDDFPGLRGFIEGGYTPVLDKGLFVLYERTDALAASR